MAAPMANDTCARSCAKGQSPYSPSRSRRSFARRLESILAVDVERPSSARDASAGPLVVALPEARPAAASKAMATGVGLDFGAAVTEQAVSPNSGPIFGVEAGVRISLPSRRLGLVASGAYDPRFDAPNGPAISEVSVASFRLIPSIELIDLDTFGASLGGGGGGDLFSVAPLVVKGSMAKIEKAMDEVDPVVSGQLVLHLRLAGRLALIMAFDLDYESLESRGRRPFPGSLRPTGARVRAVASSPDGCFRRVCALHGGWSLREPTPVNALGHSTPRNDQFRALPDTLGCGCFRSPLSRASLHVRRRRRRDDVPLHHVARRRRAIHPSRGH